MMKLRSILIKYKVMEVFFDINFLARQKYAIPRNQGHFNLFYFLSLKFCLRSFELAEIARYKTKFVKSIMTCNVRKESR